MKQIFYEMTLKTKGAGLYVFTEQTQEFINKNKLANGILNINILHTSASLTIQENADPDVLFDLNNFFKGMWSYAQQTSHSNSPASVVLEASK